MSTYVAVTNIKAAGQDGQPRTILSGDTIEDFESWGYEAQMAALRLGHVRKEGAMHPANLSTEGGYLHFKTEPAYVDPEVTRAKAAETNPKAVFSLDGVNLSYPSEDNTPETLEDAAGEPPQGFVCSECGKVCRSERGLDKHKAAAHPSQAKPPWDNARDL